MVANSAFHGTGQNDRQRAQPVATVLQTSARASCSATVKRDGFKLPPEGGHGAYARPADGALVTHLRPICSTLVRNPH